MATNNILPWASGTDANVLTDADYASALSANGAYQNGVQTGQASSKQANKTWRQAVAPASGVAQFIVDNLGVDVSDSDAPSIFSARLANASIKLGQISPYNSDYAASVGGYKLNDIVSDASTPGVYWRSTVSNNLTVPSASSTEWRSLFADYISGTLGVIPKNGDKQGTGLHYNGSTGQPSFVYSGGSGDLAWESDLTAETSRAKAAEASAQATANAAVNGGDTSGGRKRGESLYLADNGYPSFGYDGGTVQLALLGQLVDDGSFRIVSGTVGSASQGRFITFPTAFSSAPVVLINSINNSDINCHPYSISETGFYYHGNAGATSDINYIAYGPK